MKNIKQNITRAILVLFVLTAFTSCDETGDTNPGGTSAESVAGEWFITLSDPSGAIISEHDIFNTYNTAANDDTFWLDDHDSAGAFKVKANFTKDATFSVTSAANEYNDRTVTILDGKIEKGAGLSKAGHKVDKISFKAEFSDEPGVIYSYEGHKRTGFLEDEY